MKRAITCVLIFCVLFAACAAPTTPSQPAAYAGPTDTPTSTPTITVTSGTPTDTPTITPTITITPGTPTDTPTITPTITVTPGTPTSTPTPTPSATPPSGPLVPLPKPPLPMDPCPYLDKLGVPIYKTRVIGYAFPDGLLALRSSPLLKPVKIENSLSLVAVVQVARGLSSLPEGVYAVAIDVDQPAGIVSGRLISCDDSTEPVDLGFQRIPQVRNPERDAFLKKYKLDDYKPLPLDVTIQAGSACFIVLADDTGTKATRYCTMDNSPLSVKQSFPERYTVISTALGQTEKRLKAAGFLPADDSVLVDRTLSGIEDPDQIKACKPEEGCKADLLGAPVKGMPIVSVSGQPAARIIAALQILQTIQFSGTVPIQPGDYVVNAWYASDKVFIGATISGLLDKSDSKVLDQQIPAIPATFISADPVADEFLSEITGFHFGPFCLAECP